MVIRVHRPGQLKLPQIAQATYTLRFDLRFGQGREQERCQNGDDSDDDEQLDEGKPSNRLEPSRRRRTRSDCIQFHSAAMNAGHNSWRRLDVRIKARWIRVSSRWFMQAIPQ